MAVTVTIRGTPIPFPTSGESPNWAEAVTEFAQAVEDALITLGLGIGDITPQIYNIDAFNGNVIPQDVQNLAFSNTLVRSSVIRYAVTRTSSTETAIEAGLILIAYNPSLSVGNKWYITTQKVGDGKISFSITDAGQIQFTTTALGGINYSGEISFAAVSLLQ